MARTTTIIIILRYYLEIDENYQSDLKRHMIVSKNLTKESIIVPYHFGNAETDRYKDE